jgi:cytoskeletal protein RodZ
LKSQVEQEKAEATARIEYYKKILAKDKKDKDKKKDKKKKDKDKSRSKKHRRKKGVLLRTLFGFELGYLILGYVLFLNVRFLFEFKRDAPFKEKENETRRRQ